MEASPAAARTADFVLAVSACLQLSDAEATLLPVIFREEDRGNNGRDYSLVAVLNGTRVVLVACSVPSGEEQPLGLEAKTLLAPVDMLHYTAPGNLPAAGGLGPPNFDVTAIHDMI